jgi:hypothetical protein
MADQSRLVSAGTNYYLEGGGEYTGSGTPWTAVGTSPYELAMNDVAGAPWTPQVSTRQEVYGGGPPFRNGQTLIYDSYGNVTETLVIQCRANSHDNAVFLLQQLRRILNTALFSTPCVLAVQPNGATNAVYYEIYGADVQEHPGFINEEAGVVAAGSALVRALVTWRRSPHGGLLSTGETLINAQTFNNTGTGSPDNIVAYSSGSGEMVYEGQPLNIKFLPTFGGITVLSRIFLASIADRLYTTTGATSTSTSTMGDGTSFATPFNTQDITTVLSTRVKPRILVRLASSSAILQLSFRVFLGNGDNDSIYRSPWVSPSGTGTTLVDLGSFPTNVFRRSLAMTTPKVYILLYIRSTTGASASVNLTYTELLYCYDFARIDSNSFAVNGSSDYVLVDQFAEQTSYVCLPFDSPRVIGVLSGVSGSPEAVLPHRGTLPRYIDGASLYAAWMTTTSYTHTTTAATTITATHAPLWRTLRGAD